MADHFCLTPASIAYSDSSFLPRQCVTWQVDGEHHVFDCYAYAFHLSFCTVIFRLVLVISKSDGVISDHSLCPRTVICR